MDVIRQPLPGLPPPEPEPIEADYVDVTPSKT